MRVLDATGKGVYPGFIDAYRHIGIAEEQTTAQTDSSNEGTNPVTPFIRAIDKKLCGCQNERQRYSLIEGMWQ